MTNNEILAGTPTGTHPTGTHPDGTHPDGSRGGGSARRTGRAITVAAAAAGCLLLWAVDVPWGGAELAVRQGGTVQQVGPVAVVTAALLAAVAAWGLLALLERTVRRPVAVFRIVALIVLALSLAGPLGSGDGLGSRLMLLGMHLTVGTALIAGLPGRRACR